jgi:hypothetical protein
MISILQHRDADEYSRNKGTLDALVRPLQVPSASKPSTDRQSATASYSASNEPRQSQLPQWSEGSLVVSVDQSGARRSARLAGARLPRDTTSSAPLRRSVRLNSAQRR